MFSNTSLWLPTMRHKQYMLQHNSQHNFRDETSQDSHRKTSTSDMEKSYSDKSYWEQFGYSSFSCSTWPAFAHADARCPTCYCCTTLYGIVVVVLRRGNRQRKCFIQKNLRTSNQQTLEPELPVYKKNFGTVITKTIGQTGDFTSQLMYFVQLLYLGKLLRPKYHEFSFKLLHDFPDATILGQGH